MNPLPPRAGSGRLAGDWDAKTSELHKKKPVYRRQWFRRTILIALAAFLLAGIVGGALLRQRHREQLAENARQQRGLAAFLRHREFTAFGRACDAQILAALNFAAVRRIDAQALLPSVAAWETAHQAMPWTLAVQPLPVSAAGDSARVIRAARATVGLLAQRGFALDPARRVEARRLFLRLLAPHAVSFAEADPENSFAAVWHDVRMQDTVLAAFAARSGPDTTLPDVEGIFALYAAIGPAMWQAIEQDTAAREVALPAPFPSPLPR